MKKLKSNDFVKCVIDDHTPYYNCVMANGVEVQLSLYTWGVTIGVYDIEGRLITKENQPALRSISCKIDVCTTLDAVLLRASEVYDRSLRTKRISVKYA